MRTIRHILSTYLVGVANTVAETALRNKEPIKQALSYVDTSSFLISNTVGRM
jgi:hypothetical protein